MGVGPQRVTVRVELLSRAGGHEGILSSRCPQLPVCNEFSLPKGRVLQAIEMAQWVKILATKHDNLISTPNLQIRGENWL